MDPATTEPVDRYLEMMFFTSDNQIQWTQRFCSSFMIEIDTTFNTNNLRLPLIILTGIANTGMSFLLLSALRLVKAKLHLTSFLRR